MKRPDILMLLHGCVGLAPRSAGRIRAGERLQNRALGEMLSCPC